MKLEAILYIVLLILGIVVAIAPWTFVPVGNNPRCRHISHLTGGNIQEFRVEMS